MAVKSYGFAVGNLRARENTLLKYNDYLTLLGAENVKELALMLREKGIGDAINNSTVPEILACATEKLWSYIWDIAPDTAVFKPFLYENDFHNLKAILKAKIKGVSSDDLLIEPATVEVALVKKAVDEKRFDLLPPFLKNTVIRAYDILAKSGDVQLADGIIDAACIKARLEAAEESGNRIVKELILVDSFYKNIKVALRCAKAQKDAAFTDEVLTETPIVSKRDLKSAALSGEERVLELLSLKTNMGGNEAAEKYKESASRFEKYADDRFMVVARECRFITIGVEPLIGYMVASLAEIKNLRIIYSGIKTGQSEEKTKERLREI